MKNLIRFITFMVIFITILNILSFIYINKEEGYKFSPFYSEPRNSIDVLIFGTSLSRGAILPSVLWADEGITSYNISASASPSAVQYYWLQETLKYQSPKVVIINGRYLFENEEVLFDTKETRFRQALDPMRLSWNKIKAIREIVSKSENQTFMSYLFPLLRYHDRIAFEEKDFQFSVEYQRHDRMGCAEPKLYTSITSRRIPRLVKDPSYNPEYKVSGTYLTKMIDLCKLHDISVIITIIPTSKADYSIYMHDELQEYADIHGVDFLDFIIGQPGKDVAINFKTDFYNVNHVNINGANKISHYYASYLAENFDFTDKRDMDYDHHWDIVMRKYQDLYDEWLDNYEHYINGDEVD